MNNIPQPGLTDVLVPVSIIALVFLLNRTGFARVWRSPLPRMIIIFALAAVSYMMPMALRYGNTAALQIEGVLAAGAEWCVFFEISRRARYRFGRNFLVQFLGLTALIWVLEAPVYDAISSLFSVLMGHGLSQILHLPESFWASLQALVRYPYNFFNLMDAVTFVGVASCLGGGASLGGAANKVAFWESQYFGGTGGYQDMEMSPSKSHTTRLLCASAFLGGARFREQVLQFLANPSRAVAPEVGTDLRLVAQVCKFGHDRDHKFEWLFCGCAFLALLGALVDPSIGLAVLVLASGAVGIAKVWPEKFSFVRSFAKHLYDPEKVGHQFTAQLEAEQAAGLSAEDQNLIVYQGFSPFVGAGTSLGGWSFVVNVDKGKEELGNELEPVKFETQDLYSEIDSSIESLGLNGLSHRDMFFVFGSDIRDDRNILPDSYGRPVQRLNPDLSQKYFVANDPHVRHYKWIRVMDWGNELTTSYFLRCSLRGNNLFVEINRYLLTPLAATYRTVDALSEEDWKKRVGAVVIGLISGPFRALVSPLLVFARLQEYFGEMFDQKEKHRRELIDDNPLFNYGVAHSFRDITSSDLFMHYFQKLDGDFYSKVLEREILAAIVEFLDARNIDTSELKERQSTILNSGIIIHGGDVNAESLAVGAGSQAVKGSKPEPPRKSQARRTSTGAV